MFGRDRELAEALAALEAAASGTPQVLLVGGDAGIGKTTLTSAISDVAGAQGFRLLVGHCLDIEGRAELQPVREALRQAVVGRADGDLPPVTRRLAEGLRGGDEDVRVEQRGSQLRYALHRPENDGLARRHGDDELRGRVERPIERVPGKCREVRGRNSRETHDAHVPGARHRNRIIARL
jgi:ABC-type microcin C transport system duplicated ATPase subunit YejF